MKEWLSCAGGREEEDGREAMKNEQVERKVDRRFRAWIRTHLSAQWRQCCQRAIEETRRRIERKRKSEKRGNASWKELGLVHVWIYVACQGPGGRIGIDTRR